jgi:hypothetical protein
MSSPYLIEKTEPSGLYVALVVPLFVVLGTKVVSIVWRNFLVKDEAKRI